MTRQFDPFHMSSARVQCPCLLCSSYCLGCATRCLLFSVWDAAGRPGPISVFVPARPREVTP